MQFDFTDRTVVVTGGAQGIGRSLVAFFAAAGARVWSLDVAPSGVGHHEPNVEAVACDVSSAAAVAHAFSAILDASAGIDILVNNAGILRDSVVWKLNDEQWAAVLGVHLTGAFNCVREVVPTMRAAAYGRIINVTSYTGLHGNFGQANYAAAKAGLIGLTKTCAKELASFGITVNAVSPNARTAMVDAIPPARRDELAQLAPMGRFGEPDEMVHAVGFLASREAGYVTGVVLPVDGGLSM